MTTEYTLDSAGSLPQVIAAHEGTTTTPYLQIQGQLRAQQVAGAWQYVLPDHLGSVRQLADGSGTVAGVQQYAPFGTPTDSYGSASSVFGFTGEPHDATSLIHLRARYYSPQQGRFLSVDPFEGMAHRPSSLHAYQYGYNNPLLFTDPSGKTAGAAGAGGVTTTCLGLLIFDGPVWFGDTLCVAILLSGVAVTSDAIADPPDITFDPGGSYRRNEVADLPRTEVEWEPERGPTPGAAPRPVPIGTPEPGQPDDTCDDKEPKFYYTDFWAYNSSADTRAGFEELHQRLRNSSLAGTNGIAGNLSGQWNQVQERVKGSYPLYVGWAYQGQRALYYHSRGVAQSTHAGGVPDIKIQWNTKGNPPLIEAVETKAVPANAPGDDFARKLQKEPKIKPSELARYNLRFPGAWLLEVNKLDPSAEAELKVLGGKRFNDQLYQNLSR